MTRLRVLHLCVPYAAGGSSRVALNLARGHDRAHFDPSVLFFSTDLNGIILGYVPQTVQWSVPVLAGVGWYAVKLLTKPKNQSHVA